MKTAAKIISTVFHPLAMPIIGLLIIFNTDSYINYAIDIETKIITLLLISIYTLIVPILTTLLLLFSKFINSLEMETQKERIIPYLFTITCYIITLYQLAKSPAPPIIFNFMKGATLSVMLAFIINIRWKISAHMIGIGGLTGALLCISMLLEVYITPYLVYALLIAGLIGSSRLILKAHTPLQIYVGFAVGVICQFAVLYF
ncbi:MAG: hypothetical protein COB15_14550 [Flavobacteriales bacterium]|nr:MAG: hypothetical protein COB15_14550 [Flavobacteriales bacterium]